MHDYDQEFALKEHYPAKVTKFSLLYFYIISSNASQIYKFIG